MGHPAEKDTKKPAIKRLENGRRFLQKTCKHCGAPVELELEPEGQAPAKWDTDAILLDLADSVACDDCARSHVSRMEARRKREEARHMLERKQVLAGFGKHALKNSLPELEIANRRSWTIAREWIADPSTNVVVQGDPDSGKTWLARTLVIEAWLAGKPIMEVAGWELFSGELLYRSEEISERTKRLRSTAVLYIQGLDRGEPRTKHLDLLLNIMEERYERGAITIIETQLDGQKICDKWERLTGDPAIGGDILSRLHPLTKIVMQRTERDGAEVGMRQLAAMHRQQ